MPVMQIKYVKGVDLSPMEVEEAKRRFSEMKLQDPGQLLLLLRTWWGAAEGVAGSIGCSALSTANMMQCMTWQRGCHAQTI